ncbi:MAG: sugar transferase [Thermoguttaceae bacterium]
MSATHGEAAVYGDRSWVVAQDRTAAKLIASSYHCRKQAAERLIAALLLILAAPAIVVLAALVRLTSPGPALFSQRRVGKNGRPFLMHKLRTMRVDAEEATGPVWGLPHDPRTTPIGKALRRLHLDELPQLINVVKGEMSLVGPRPERPEFVRVLSEAIPGYLDRIAVRPGITGLAQLNLPPDTDLNCVRRKLVLDREYIGRANAWLDLRLLVCTAFRMFKLPSHWVLGPLGIRRQVTLPPASDETSRAADGDGVHSAIAPGSLVPWLREASHHGGQSHGSRAESQSHHHQSAGRSGAGRPKPR